MPTFFPYFFSLLEIAITAGVLPEPPTVKLPIEITFAFTLSDLKIPLSKKRFLIFIMKKYTSAEGDIINLISLSNYLLHLLVKCLTHFQC